MMARPEPVDERVLHLTEAAPRLAEEPGAGYLIGA
jgi:hypothetical protein